MHDLCHRRAPGGEDRVDAAAARIFCQALFSSGWGTTSDIDSDAVLSHLPVGKGMRGRGRGGGVTGQCFRAHLNNRKTDTWPGCQGRVPHLGSILRGGVSKSPLSRALRMSQLRWRRRRWRSDATWCEQQKQRTAPFAPWRLLPSSHHTRWPH